MCGISGFFTVNPQRAELLRSMTSLVRHRGPDDEGYVVFSGLDRPATVLGGSDTLADCSASPLPYAPKIRMEGDEHILLGLGHRRLSIVDLAVTGHQPMCSSDGRYWIVYNGEVYNHIELRDELKDLGYSFHSRSDTEVILAAWDCWGESCLHRLNGMFAFALYERQTQSLCLVRDRFGIKPLYYWVSPAGFLAFASEIKQFSTLPGWAPRVNGQRAYDYLVWGISDHTKETLFHGVFQLGPGKMIRVDLRKFSGERHPFRPNEPLTARAWYTPEPRSFEGTLDEAAAKFHDLFFDAVRLRLRSDVPVGSCLSGGLDSSSIVCTINRLLRHSTTQAAQKSFSSCSHEKEFDEREYIDEVVKTTGHEAHYVYPLLDNLFDTLDEIIWHQDEPFGSTGIYAQWSVFALANGHGIKVMLDGQGADEMLAGYHTYFPLRQASLLRQVRLLSFVRDVAATRRLHGNTLLKTTRDIASLMLPANQRRFLSKLFRIGDTIPRWLDLHRMGAQGENPLSLGGEKPGTVQELSLSQLTSTSIPKLLHWEDRDSMAHSIEARVPFLDYRLVELAISLPEEFKLHEGVTKRVLREAMQGVLPEKIRLRRDKLGFATPGEIWIREHAPQKFRQEFRQAIENSHGLLSDSASAVLDDMIDNRRQFDFLAWRIICFGKWFHRYNIRV